MVNIKNLVGIILLVICLFIGACIFLKELALKKAGNVIAKSPKKKIDGIYENGIIKYTKFTDWKKIQFYDYNYHHEIAFLKRNGAKEIVIKFNVGDFDNVFRFLDKQGLHCIDRSI